MKVYIYKAQKKSHIENQYLMNLARTASASVRRNIESNNFLNRI